MLLYAHGAGTLSHNGNDLTVADKTLGAGNYTVSVYKAVSYNSTIDRPASPSALTFVTQNSITITDSQPTFVSLTKDAHIVNGGTDAEMLLNTVPVLTSLVPFITRRKISRRFFTTTNSEKTKRILTVKTVCS